jgi:hypothetical protein
MLGHGEEWFYRGLAGISVDMAKGPEGAIELRPSLVAGVDSAAAEYGSAMGVVRCGWRRRAEGHAVFDVTIPVGAKATLRLDGVSGLNAAGQPGVLDVKKTAGNWQVRLGSGVYEFVSR